MGSKTRVWCLLSCCFFLLSLNLSSFVQSSSNSIGSLEVLIHKHAFTALGNRRPRTGALYNASLPASLAGMKLSVVRLRSKTMWREGANFSNFHIPPHTLPVPYVRRLLIVCHDLGNWSTQYFNVSSGYTLLTPVVGFLIYDSPSNRPNTRNLTKLSLNTMGQPISVEFKNLSAWVRKRAKCATFDSKGRVILSGVEFPGVCYTRNQGHFSLMVPYERKMKKWGVGFVVGASGLAAAWLVGIFLLANHKAKRNCEMEREAEGGEATGSIWIYNTSKMPRAMVTRTHPAIENMEL